MYVLLWNCAEADFTLRFSPQRQWVVRHWLRS